MVRNHLLPVPPEELQGMQLKVEYISVMTQAQKAIVVSNIERFVGFVGGLAQMKPETLDKLNTDEMIDAYAESIGVSPTIVSSLDEVAAIRQQRAEQQAQMQQMQMVQAVLDGSQTLSNTAMDNESALAALAGGT